MKIVTDSSADIRELYGADFASAPLKIITSEREYVDDPALDVEGMVNDLASYKGRSTTSCPNPEEWIAAFGDADEVFCVTITSGLSGSYNSATVAARLYEEEHPGRRVYVVDSLSTGPEMRIMMEKLVELYREGKSFDEICTAIEEYKKQTELIFMLESMRNLANNGRVSHLVAKFAGLLGIRVVARASDVGDIEPLDKPRGAKAALDKIVERMTALGYKGGRVRITHCFNEAAAHALREMLVKIHTGADILIDKCGGLCSFYAERGGLLVGFEK